MIENLRLHYAPDNASLCVRLALSEMGLPFETILVDRRARGQKAPEYLRLNPNGLIPTLETPDGPIYETAAILLWLADRQGDLFPAEGAKERGDALKWLFWLSNTLHSAERMLFYPDQYIAAEFQDALSLRTRARIAALFALLDAENPEFLWGPASILQCYLAPLLRWPRLYGGGGNWLNLSDYPSLSHFAKTFETRPSVLCAAAAEGLGPTPFSDPILPDPPEGSAL